MLFTIEFIKYTGYQQEPESVEQSIKNVEASDASFALQKVLWLAPKKYDIIYIIPKKEAR